MQNKQREAETKFTGRNNQEYYDLSGSNKQLRTYQTFRFESKNTKTSQEEAAASGKAGKGVAPKRELDATSDGSGSILESFSIKYLKKCQRNIFSEDEGYTDSDVELFNELEKEKAGSICKTKNEKDQFYGVYKHPKMQYLEKLIKDEFSTFEPLSFDDQKAENEENDPFSQVESPESFQNLRRKLIDEIYEEQIFQQTVQPKLLAQADREAVQTEFEQYFKNFDTFQQKTKMSFELE